MDVTLVKEIIQEAIEKNLHEKDICFNKNINLNTYRYFKTKKEICSILNISLSLLYFYQNRETYIKMKNKKLNLESEQADKGIVDIEEEQSGDIV